MSVVSKIKIAAVVQVGPINSCGYQYFSKETLNNFCNFFDMVYVISSTEKTKHLPIKRNNLELFSNDKTWIVGPNLWVNNITPFINKFLKRDKIDFFIIIHINQYVDSIGMENIRQHLNYMKNNNIPWDWIFKKYQSHNCLYFPSAALPWIINAKFVDVVEIIPDGILFGAQKKYVRRSFFPKASNYIIDLFCGFTYLDIKHRATFLKRYNDKDLQVFNLGKEKIIKYFEKKLLNMIPEQHDFSNYMSKKFPSHSLSRYINLNYIQKFYFFCRISLRYKICNLLKI